MRGAGKALQGGGHDGPFLLRARLVLEANHINARHTQLQADFRALDDHIQLTFAMLVSVLRRVGDCG